jgi:hypothetical protein
VDDAWAVQVLSGSAAEIFEPENPFRTGPDGPPVVPVTQLPA